MPDATGRTDSGDDRQHQVFRSDAMPGHTLEADPHRFRLALPQALGRHHMRDLGRTDAECQRAQRTVRGGMGVTTHQGQTGLSQTLLRTDHMGNPLALVIEEEQRHTSLAGINFQLLDQAPMLRILDGGHIPPRRRVVMIRRCQRELRAAQRNAARLQSGKACCRAIVHQMTVDIQQVITVTAVDNDMAVPDLVEEGS